MNSTTSASSDIPLSPQLLPPSGGMPPLPELPPDAQKTDDAAKESLSSASQAASPPLSKREIKELKQPSKETLQLNAKARKILADSRSSKAWTKLTPLGSSHKVEQTLSGALKEVAVKIGVVVGLIVFAPLLLLVGGTVRAATALKGRIQAKKDPQNLDSATKNMKNSEEVAKLETLQSVLAAEKGSRTSEDFGRELHQNVKDDLGKIETKQDKLARFYIKEMARKGTPDTPQLRAQAESLTKNLKVDDFKNAETLLKALDSNAEPFKSQMPLFFAELRATDPTALDQQAIRLNNALVDLVDLLETPTADITDANRADINMQITQKLRAALGTLAYASLKESPDNRSVKLLHKLASAMWNEVHALEGYKELGEATLKNVDKYNELENPLATLTGAEVSALLKASHKKAAQELMTDHGIPAKILYAIRHPVQALSSMASEGGLLRTVAGMFGREIYDSHGLLSNNPSLQGVTSATLTGDIRAQINNCYGGSPTVGDELISPEFEAVCQASENKRFSENPDPTIPDVVYYTNFQNIENRAGEGGRSQTIMAQNLRFPLSFTGMTLAKDSEFYMMPSFKKDRESIQWQDAKAFGKEMMEAMTQDACFSNVGRAIGPTGNGFYFPGKKEDWEPALQKIINQAQEHFKEIVPDGSEGAYKLRGAFQEYVYSMVQSYMELKLAKDMAEQTGRTDILIMAIRACKENIDRGGAENAKYMYSRLPPEMPHKEKVALITGVFQSRALSARNRIILEHRLPQVLAFMEFVEPEKYQQDMAIIMKDLNIGFAKDGIPAFKPALGEPTVSPAP